MANHQQIELTLVQIIRSLLSTNHERERERNLVTATPPWQSFANKKHSVSRGKNKTNTHKK